MQQLELIIGNDGVVRTVNSVEVAGLFSQTGSVTLTRASHVLPVNKILRKLFRWSRDTFGETGRIAALSRRVPCLWAADLFPVGGPVFGPYRNRQEAIDKEIAWLNDNGIPVPTNN